MPRSERRGDPVFLKLQPADLSIFKQEYKTQLQVLWTIHNIKKELGREVAYKLELPPGGLGVPRSQELAKAKEVTRLLAPPTSS